VYIVFAPYSPSYMHSPHPSPHWYQPLRQNLFCPPVLQFCLKKNDSFVLNCFFYQLFLNILPIRQVGPLSGVAFSWKVCSGPMLEGK
jgi:hypothetical protein